MLLVLFTLNQTLPRCLLVFLKINWMRVCKADVKPGRDDSAMRSLLSASALTQLLLWHLVKDCKVHVPWKLFWKGETWDSDAVGCNKASIVDCLLLILTLIEPGLYLISLFIAFGRNTYVVDNVWRDGASASNQTHDCICVGSIPIAAAYFAA